MAIRRALVFAHESGLWVSSVESDSINAVRAIDSCDEFAIESHVIQDIRKLLSLVSDGCCCFVPRERNKAAYSLAKFALPIPSVRYWLEESPECISHVITSDLLDNTQIKNQFHFKKKKDNVKHLIFFNHFLNIILYGM